MNFLDNLLESSAKVADQVAAKAGEYIDKGKGKIDEMSIKNELSKAQRELGVLVYTLHKSGQENQELLNQYLNDVDRLQKQLDDFRKAQDGHINVQSRDICPNCGVSVDSNDVFCRNCGNKLK